MKTRGKIGELLVRGGLITEDQLAEALKKQKRSRKRLGEILIKMGYVNSGDLVRMLSEQAAVPFVELRAEMLDEKLIKSFPEKFLYKNNLIPVYESKKKLSVAVGDPTNRAIISEIKKIKNKEIEMTSADPEQIVQLLDKYFLIDQTERILGDR